MKIKKKYMKTYILFWNPAISCYKLDDFQEKLGGLEYNDLNWSVWEHGKSQLRRPLLYGSLWRR